MLVKDTQVYQVKELAELLKVSVDTIYRAIGTRQLNAYKFGRGTGVLRIAGHAINEWLASCAEVAAQSYASDVSGEVA